MTEQIDIRGKRAWILIEPHAIKDSGDEPAEYFTASYTFGDAADGPGVILFLEGDNLPKRFESPVQALEYANEKLLGLV